ncbi:VOC family protein [Vibrio sp. SCSIO 43135]|uniref:VOC family protein n=1 Tax=Vibrio sp. SCSIO 43135 TaxID=2819096 RepID=UPI0020759541|nr:VOC family protein [Vibrio sp. SCSIO 43135]USD43572.1 VOC family protein [Vibrio sp. SCSIO 43135]
MNIHTLCPYLRIPGQCEEAFNFYAHVLNGTIKDKHYFKQSPMQDQVDSRANWQDKLLHIEMKCQGFTLMGSDGFPEQKGQPSDNITLVVSVEQPQEAINIFQSFSAKGDVIMPIQKTFWAQQYGIVQDHFGITWNINCH